ncbi:MAG: thymidine phosphorylase family protein [Pseudomonadota bacterium]
MTHHHPAPNTMHARRVGVDTYQEPVVYMRDDCPVCRSEGFTAQTRLEIALNGRRVIATLNIVSGGWLRHGEAGLSESAWAALGAADGTLLAVSHAPPLESLSHLRAKVYGHRLGAAAFSEVIRDVAAGRYSDLHLAAFVTACAGDGLDVDETVALTRAMVDVGERLDWGRTPVVDKHCVGGLPGNRTTLLVVPIVAACGLTMPKTSSRAITSPAGTADTMEVLAPVDLDVAAMRRTVERTGGCIVWGGSVRLSPADDILIRVERPLDIDGEGQLVASVLSKKAAAGSTHVLIDLPVGPTAKVRSAEAAAALGARLVEVGRAIGLRVALRMTDGLQPVGRGIGPALEARDVLAVLRGQADSPPDLRQRALALAGDILELGGAATHGDGLRMATEVLADGRAWARFQAICEAQGGLREVPLALHQHVVVASGSGVLAAIDNRVLARAAKLAGAPKAPAAGIELHVRLGERIHVGQPLCTLHAQARGELDYARRYVEARPSLFQIEEAP